MSLINLQPVATITSTATLTSPSIVATSTVTATVHTESDDFIFVSLIPVEIDGCSVTTYNQKIANIGGGSFGGAAELCAPYCIGKKIGKNYIRIAYLLTANTNFSRRQYLL